jgi:cell division protein ZipA
MEFYLRLGLLATAGMIIVLISLDAWFRWRSDKKAQKYVSPDDTVDEQSFSADSVLGLDKVAKRQTEPLLSINDLNDIEADEVLSDPYGDEHLQTQMDFSEAMEAPVAVKQTTASAQPVDLAKDLLIMHVIAKPGQLFGSYDLLQTLSATGLQFGEMNIFHYYLPAALGRAKLFSVSSATEPGDFNLDKIGQFSCKGLTIFTNLRDVPDAKQAFESMLVAAEQLADDLDGQIYADSRTLMTDDVLDSYWLKVSNYSINQMM